MYRYLIFTSMLKIASASSSLKTGNSCRVEGITGCVDQMLSKSDGAHHPVPCLHCGAVGVQPALSNEVMNEPENADTAMFLSPLHQIRSSRSCSECLNKRHKWQTNCVCWASLALRVACRIPFLSLFLTNKTSSLLIHLAHTETCLKYSYLQ